MTKEMSNEWIRTVTRTSCSSIDGFLVLLDFLTMWRDSLNIKIQRSEGQKKQRIIVGRTTVISWEVIIKETMERSIRAGCIKLEMKKIRIQYGYAKGSWKWTQRKEGKRQWRMKRVWDACWPPVQGQQILKSATEASNAQYMDAENCIISCFTWIKTNRIDK